MIVVISLLSRLARRAFHRQRRFGKLMRRDRDLIVLASLTLLDRGFVGGFSRRKAGRTLQLGFLSSNFLDVRDETIAHFLLSRRTLVVSVVCKGLKAVTCNLSLLIFYYLY